MYHFEIVTNTKKSLLNYFRKPQRYHWRIRRNGNIIATSETYYNLDDCTEVATHLQSKIKGATLKHITE